MRHILISACLLLAQPAHAVGRLAQVVVIDRDSGSTLESYYHHGEYWIAGKPGAHYAIEIRNTLGERLLAVTSVDGINVLTGDTARWDQPGYVLRSQERYQVTGWRKSQTEVATFEFAAAPDSYAARTGRSANIGVIGVAVFRERLPEPAAERAPPAPAAAPESSAESRMQAYGSPAAKSADAARAPDRAAAPPLAHLGTGHGARAQSYVEFVDFVRSSDQPSEIVRIRYDSRENLIALGIIPHGTTLAAVPEPFPGSMPIHFVPDPPACTRGRQCFHE
ncbi:MAG TPA: hypothetical protein VMT66_10705 [Steroidobacteraceae bacterium]|nr:hypothetical protein [Steroidobacteraceae bacterium]